MPKKHFEQVPPPEASEHDVLHVIQSLPGRYHYIRLSPSSQVVHTVETIYATIEEAAAVAQEMHPDITRDVELPKPLDYHRKKKG